MLTDAQREALRRWYAEASVLDEARRHADAGKYELLEDLLHRRHIQALSRPEGLPDYLMDEGGAPLFPEGLDPRKDEAAWQDAIEVGWEVVEAHLGLSHDAVHRRIASEQHDDWQAFLESVERRKRERGGAT